MSDQREQASFPELPGLQVSRSSVVHRDDAWYFLAADAAGQRRLGILAPAGSPAFDGFAGRSSAHGERTLLLTAVDSHNAVALRDRFAWLRPTPLGLRTSAGLGDRLGLATPGHLRAVREAGGHLAPIPAQQSIREMSRTERSPQQVMDDAMWGVFSEGWHSGFGADADHLKTTDDIDRCLAAGYTFYTFDPGEHVDDAAETATAQQLRAGVDALPWDRLEDSPAALAARYLGTDLHCEGQIIRFDESALLRAAVKYGRAVAHVALLYRHLEQAAAGRNWEVEVSVDETAAPTTHAEHLYIATELRRLGVRWVSLAPRFIGRFEKGVDYIGDVSAFEADFAVHAAIARALGPYKLSLHSGSDKFSIYDVCARQTRGLVHLKTAGTSYLEALRTSGQFDPDLLGEIYLFARQRFPIDRASYHISADLDAAPERPSPAEPTALLDQFDARQILHVTFGSVLTATGDDGGRRFYDRLMQILRIHSDAYATTLCTHFLRHLRPFDPWAASAESTARASGA